MTASRPHCASCSCGRRAPVQSSRAGEMESVRWPSKPAGTVSWAEHCLAWESYANRYGHQQTAERMAERGGFSYAELVLFLGHDPETWQVPA